MNMWRRTIYSIGLLLAIVTLTPQVSAAASVDDWRNDYNKSIAIATLLECQNFFVQEVDDDMNADADSIAAAFISTPVCIRYENLTARQALINLSGGSLNREVMMSLGYTWNNDKTKLIRPDLLTLRKKILGKFNSGKEADLSSPSMQWAAADAYITRNCTLEKKDVINSQTRVNLAKEIKMAQDGAVIDEWGSWNSYYIIINELDGDKLQQALYKIYQKESLDIKRQTVTEESCKAQAEKQSLNLKILFERGKKATAEARSNAAGRYIAEELCKPLQTSDPNEYNPYNICISDITKKASQCFAKYGDDIAKIKQCLIKSLPQSYHGKITDDLIKRALEHAKNSTQDQTITGGAAENEEDQPTCTITGIGWLICPTMNFIATLNDAMFNLVSRLLATRPAMFIMDDKNQTYAAWGTFRNIANVAFVIVFLVVIFSQVTSQGISNYGIKRILPRLIIGAILINASFLISALAADVSSILGSSIDGFLKHLAAKSQPVNNWHWGHMVGLVLGGGTVSAAAGVASIAALWAIGIPGAIGYLVAMLMTLLILIGRQAGIILLATLSPLAFAALILPNTEKWFKRWMSMFGGLLMVFPIVSLLFGAGSFAAAILNKDDDYVMQIASLIVSALPLVATPMLLRKSMDSLGAIGQIAGRLGDKANSFAMKTAREGMSENSRLNEAWKGMKFNRQLKKAERRASGKGIGGRLDRSKIGRKFGLDRGAYAAQEAVDKAAEADAERKLAYEYNGDAVSALNDDNAKVRAAAAKQLAGQGDWGAGQLATYIQNGGKVDSIAMANALTSVKSSHAGVAKVGTEALHSLQTGGSSYSTNESGFQKLTADSMDGFTNAQYAAQSVRAISDAVAANGISADKASEILNDPTVGKDIKGGTGAILGGLRNAAAIKQSGANPGYIAYSDEQLVGSIAASTTGMSAGEIKSLIDLGFIGKSQANRILKGAQTSNTEINKILQDFTSKH